ncbi:MAG: hypothetical protein ACE5FS_00430 [Paracoccaceae bacterium]
MSEIPVSGPCRPRRVVACLGAVTLLAACSLGEMVNKDTTVDQGIDGGSLEAMTSGIWVDPDGCDHWIIDDGVEGYMTPRLTPEGLPLCREGAVPGTVSGDFARVLIGRN